MPRHAAGASFNSRRWTEAEAREVLAALEQSGQSITAFAAARGLDPQRLYYWRRRVAGGDRITFRELVVRPVPSASQQMPFEILLGLGSRRAGTAVVRASRSCKGVRASNAP